ncbi:MAG: glycosyltransferase family 4 protein [Actinomycetota bacterium]|nr:glycosyltransferase family 4 protein [Actinomycetota bacterium]
MGRHLLVTNDFPPKVGGIQNYLWELWRRLPPDEVVVLTTPHAGAVEFDARQAYRVVRDRDPVLLPRPGLARRIRTLAHEVGAELVVLDPALPLGHLGPSLGMPYGLVLHGAEVTVPGRLPVSKQALGRVLRGAEVVVSAGEYAAAEGVLAAGRDLPTVIVPPGVDTERFRPLSPDAAKTTRERFGLHDGPLVMGVSRLVPRKGFDQVIAAVDELAARIPRLQLAIAGSGRDRRRLERLAGSCRAEVSFLGRVDDHDLPAVFGMGDVFAMPCRNRWGGLEQEGFGIVFVEAAAAGVPQVAGRSGGADEAVADGVTGVVVDDPTDPSAVAAGLCRILLDPQLRLSMSIEGRRRAVADFGYDGLADKLHSALTRSRS